MKNYPCFVWLLLVLGYLSACKKAEETKAISQEAQTYLDQVVHLMQNNSVNRKKIDWNIFKTRVNDRAQGAQSIADTYPAIQLALTMLEDNHSSFGTAHGNVFYGTSSLSCTDANPAPVPADNRIGYIKITTFTKGGQEGIAFAQSIQDSIRKADTDLIQGWIVDLRGNLGGNMWPMLAGIGPVLGEGTVGYFIDPDGNTYPWSYKNGSASTEGVNEVAVPHPYVVRNPHPKVAVLTDRAVASSGEAIVIAFKERANTRSFGTPTCGLSTANVAYTLSDGSWLNLTIATMADRTKKSYGNSVIPDETFPTVTAVEKAVAWLTQ